MHKTSTMIIAVIGLFVIISLSTIGFITLSTASKALKIEASNRLETLAQQKSAELETRLLTIESAVRNLRTTVELSIDEKAFWGIDQSDYFKSYDAYIEPYVHHVINHTPSINTSYIVFDPKFTDTLTRVVYQRQDGMTIQRADHLLILEEMASNESHMDWLRLPILKKEGLWTDPYYDYFLEEYIITYSEPLLVDGHPVGVVGANILLKDFEQFTLDINIYSTGYAFLINKNHDILAHPTFSIDENMRTIYNGLLVPISNYISLYEHGTYQYTYLDQEKIMAFDRLYNGWTIGIAPPISEVNSGLIKTRRSYYTVFITCIIIFLFIASFASKLLSSPIERLSAAVTTIGNGNFDAPINKELTNYPSEVGLLATTIEEMRLQQKDSFERLLHHNDLLDQEVAKRTKDLLDTNQKLETTIRSLENAQKTIVEMHEQEAIHDLISHLANKLSTPTMTSITAASYLLTQTENKDTTIKGLEAEQVNQSAMLIYNSQSAVKRILDSLKQLISSYSDEVSRYFPIRAHINHTLKNELSEHTDYNLTYRIEGDDQLMVYLPMDLTFKLISNFIHHSMRAANLFESSDINVKIYMKNKTLHLEYDDIIPWQSGMKEHIFNPYYQADFTNGSSGLELYLIKHIVIKAFNGRITPYQTANKTLGFHLEIPQEENS